MKRVFFFLFLCISIGAVPASAQNAENGEPGADSDSLGLTTPLDEDLEPVPINVSLPWMGGMGMYNWNLHQGLNGQVSAGVRVGLGKHNPWRGGSFFSSMAGLYAFPVSQNGRWTGAVGGYYNNYRLWGRQVNSVGLMGVVDYKINDRLSASGFVMHDFGVLGQSHGGLCSPWMMDLESPNTTIGAALDMKISEKANLSIGVSLTNHQHSIMPMEMMPVPNGSTGTNHAMRDIPQTPSNAISTGRGVR